MTATQMNAEILRNMSIIAEDEKKNVYLCIHEH